MSVLRLLAASAALVVVATPLVAQTAESPAEELVIETRASSYTFHVEIADDPRERARGLMFRRQMADDHGMLFDFFEEGRQSFWMENTYIPLDMLFINDDGTVDSIAREATPLSERSIPSDGPVRYVLEINGGLSDKLGIRPGDTVSGPAMEARE